MKKLVVVMLLMALVVTATGVYGGSGDKVATEVPPGMSPAVL